MSSRTVRILAAAALCAAWPLRALEGPALRNWAVPAAEGRRLSALGDIGSPSTFVAVTPCRVVDTRNGLGFPGAYGPPALSANVSRSFTIPAGPCTGIPAGARAYSLNLTVIASPGAYQNAFLSVWQSGGTQPTVSTLNFNAGQIVANAAVVPAASDAITVLANAQTNLIIDINGYYTNLPNTGEPLWLSTSIDGGATIVGFNNANSDGSHGVGGYAGGTGKVHGMQGQVGGTAGAGSSGVHGIGGTTAAASYGVLGETGASSSGSAAVFGNATATAGVVSGVLGQSASGDGYSAGVQGIVTNQFGNAGIFTNPGNGTGAVNTYISTVGTPGSPAPAGNQNYGLWVHGGNAYVSSGVYALSKSFVAPHPTDPSKEIVYMSVEAPTADIYFRGTAHLVNGAATVEVPEHFRVNARPETYQTNVTVAGARGSAWVEAEGPQGIVIRGTGGTVHYVVYAERDVLEPQLPVRENVHFNAAALARGDVRALPQGYLELLVKNGTLNPDLTLNKRTAERLGWTVPAGADAR